MARSHSTDKPGWTNPEVRYERADVEYRTVVVFGFVLVTALPIIVVAMFLLGRELGRQTPPEQQEKLPFARADEKRLPDTPLEAIVDVEKKEVKLYPPRAEEYLAK